jgi:predicted AAA+ superfamily ATPase
MASVKDGLFDDYFVFGGMPGTIHLKSDADKKDLLADILQSYVLKDIKALIREENVRAFNVLVYLLAQRQGGLISAADLAREIGMSVRTVESYLEILSQTYVATPVFSFSNNLGNELKKSRKIYLYDPGIRNALLRDFRAPAERPDGGAVAEGFVFNELHRLVGPDAEGRIPKGIAAFIKRYPDTKRAYILHGGASHKARVNGTDCHFRPLTDVESVIAEIGRG